MNSSGWPRCKRSSLPAAGVNGHSHIVGDRALQRVAAVLGAGLRGLDCVGRWGGEEFAMLLPHTGLAAACAATERLRRDVESQDWHALSPGSR